MSVSRETKNPVRDLVDNKTYARLSEHGLLNKTAIRNYQIRCRFAELRKEMGAGDAIDTIREQYPYIQFDTIRKIVYDIRQVRK